MLCGFGVDSGVLGSLVEKIVGCRVLLVVEYWWEILLGLFFVGG